MPFARTKAGSMPYRSTAQKQNGSVPLESLHPVM